MAVFNFFTIGIAKVLLASLAMNVSAVQMFCVKQDDESSRKELWEYFDNNEPLVQLNPADAAHWKRRFDTYNAFGYTMRFDEWSDLAKGIQKKTNILRDLGADEQHLKDLKSSYKKLSPSSLKWPSFCSWPKCVWPKCFQRRPRRVSDANQFAALRDSINVELEELSAAQDTQASKRVDLLTDWLQAFIDVIPPGADKKGFAAVFKDCRFAVRNVNKSKRKKN